MADIKAIIPGCSHTLELKNCREVMGHDDSLPFNAEIHLDGKRIGSAWNTGWGGYAEFRLSHDVTDADKSALEEVKSNLNKIQLLKDSANSKWTLEDLFDSMAEKAMYTTTRTFTVKPE